MEERLVVAENAESDVKTIVAEILLSSEMDERTFALLCVLFSSGENIPLYSHYLGMYGDERAAEMLYRALDNCNYAEYIEIKNAIERLGGIVDDARDFSDDPTYSLIKSKH